MTKPTIFTYANVTPEQIANLRAKLTAGGASISTPTLADNPNVFLVEGHGITSNASYDPATSILSVQVVSKPWIITMSAIDKRLKEALKA